MHPIQFASMPEALAHILRTDGSPFPYAFEVIGGDDAQYVARRLEQFQDAHEDPAQLARDMAAHNVDNVINRFFYDVLSNEDTLGVIWVWLANDGKVTRVYAL